MARILCSVSGIEYSCEHFPIYLTSREHHHPIFSATQKQLLSQASKWAAGELTDIDSYLLYLALFRSTDLVDFRVPAQRTNLSVSIVAQNMESLFRIVGKINVISNEKAATVLNLPHFVISPETKDLATSADWISIWETNYADYQTGYKTQTALDKISRREAALEKLIKDKTKDITSYAASLAEWASDAGDFDTHADYIVLDQNDKPIIMAEYWKRIIRACAKGDSIFHIPAVDLIDLIEHCEEYIHHGSIFSHALMTLLRDARERKDNYLGLGDIDLSSDTGFRILDADASVEDANKIAMIESAPSQMPQLKDYPSKLAYLRAKAKYDMAQSYKEELDSNENTAPNVTKSAVGEL